MVYQSIITIYQFWTWPQGEPLQFDVAELQHQHTSDQCVAYITEIHIISLQVLSMLTLDMFGLITQYKTVLFTPQMTHQGNAHQFERGGAYI